MRNATFPSSGQGESAIAKRGLINRRWLPLNALRAFEAVGQNLSFTAGAQALTVSQSAMSRHVSSLEELIGKPLFERSAIGLKLTPAGEVLLPVISKCLDRMEQTINSVRDQNGESRPLRVHMPPSLMHQAGVSLLRNFHREYPEIRIDVFSSHATGLPPTNVDMAIVYDRPSVDNQVTDLLWMERLSLLCSPETAARAKGRSIEDFIAGSELLHIRVDSEPRGLMWSIFADQHRLFVDTDRGLSFDTAISAVRYAMTAPGIVLTDIDMYESEIAAGLLVMPYDCVSTDGFGYYLKTHAEDLADPAILLFREWIIRHFAETVRGGGRPDRNMLALAL